MGRGRNVVRRKKKGLTGCALSSKKSKEEEKRGEENLDGSVCDQPISNIGTWKSRASSAAAIFSVRSCARARITAGWEDPFKNRVFIGSYAVCYGNSHV